MEFQFINVTLRKLDEMCSTPQSLSGGKILGIDTVLGLPLHALIVHFAVILVPLAALALIGTCWNSRWRKRYALGIAVIAIVGAGAAFVAAESGESLSHSIKLAAASSGQEAQASRRDGELLGEHPEEGQRAEVVAVIFASTAGALFVFDEWGARFHASGAMVSAVYAGASIAGVLAIMTMLLAGHSGAALVWKDLGNFVS